MSSSDENERHSRLASTAGRLAFYPARVAARASRNQLAEAADDLLIPELVRLLDRAFATTLPEEVVQSAVKHNVIERVAAELVRSGALDRAVNDALASPHTTELTERILQSDQMQLAIREAAASPEVRAALTRQTAGFAEELIAGIRARAVRLDDRIGRRRPAAAAPFAGIATRALAFAIDAGLIILIWSALSALIALASSLVGELRPVWLAGLLLVSGLTLVAGIYFATFWSGAGQTPGMRLLRLRLWGPGGDPPSLWRSLVRVVGTAIAIIPLFAGYLPVLFDARRRGLPDFLAGTVVVYEDEPEVTPAEPRSSRG
ncbi:MAG TPA: RDD family protein [Gaiellaceae bacterium]|nr:RDD family protein [Gaiellaceae bacterium]